MAITREATVRAKPDEIWSNLIEDPNRWADWLTPIRGYEEAVRGPARDGLEFDVRLGKLSAKTKVKEAVPGKRLQWRSGIGMMHAMGMPMKGTLEFQPHNGSTRVLLKMKVPMGPMGSLMMRMMAGLTPKDEMTKTINRIKSLSEQ